MAQSTMGHRNPGAGDNNRTKSNTFDQYYAVGVAQMAFVPVRNGEIQSRTDEVTMVCDVFDKARLVLWLSFRTDASFLPG